MHHALPLLVIPDHEATVDVALVLEIPRIERIGIGRPDAVSGTRAPLATGAVQILLSRSIQVRRTEVDVPVVLHTESTTTDSCKEFVEMGKKVGLKSDKIVKHYSPPLILEDENFGLMPSVLASEKNIVAAAKKGSRFMLETDYIDDPRRPGAVLGPKTIPKKTLSLLESGILSEDQAYKIHKQNPESTYKICLDG